jgi:hypothetical protein
MRWGLVHLLRLIESDEKMIKIKPGQYFDRSMTFARQIFFLRPVPDFLQKPHINLTFFSLKDEYSGTVEAI